MIASPEINGNNSEVFETDCRRQSEASNAFPSKKQDQAMPYAISTGLPVLEDL